VTRIDLEKLDASGDLRSIAEEAGAYDPTGTTRRNLMRNGAATAGTFAAGSALLGFLDPMEAFAAASSKQKGAYSTSLKKVNRRSKKPTANDVVIGNYALTLEYLEAAFYAAAVDANYSDPDISDAAKLLASHEADHVKLLKKVLGKAAVKQPTLNMDAVAATLKDAQTFITTAASIEPVGTAAYAGAGPYVSNIAIVQAALAIHSVEARHAALTAEICRVKMLDNPGAAPTAFDKPFTFKKTISTVSKLNFVKGDLQP
jgi:hypothetical protein